MKKILQIFIFITAIFLLVGCKGKLTANEKAVIKRFLEEDIIIFQENDNQDSVTGNIELSLNLDGYNIFWESNSLDVLLIDGNQGIITRSNDDIAISLTATLTVKSGVYETREFQIKILKNALDEEYQVTFDLNGYNGVAPEMQVVSKTTGLVKRPGNVIRSGYLLKGWKLNTLDEQFFDFKTKITSDITLYAIWQVFDSPYYSQITASEGEQLFNQLNNLISKVTAGNGSQNSSYGEVRYILEKSDINPNKPNYLWGIYDNADIPPVWNGQTMNREHVWPNSRLGIPRVNNNSRNQGSDPHNLRIIIPSTNSRRGNNYFVDANPSVDGYIPSSGTYYPGDDHRGDVARILLYMAVRYKDILSLVETPSGTTFEPSGAQLGNIKVLLKWHLEDPVDQFEINRNQVIYENQGNRNPFIDNDSWFEPVWQYLMTQANLSYN